MRPSLLIMTTLSLAIFGLAGCASISEGDCIAGSWSDIGYKDGVNGKARGKLADYAKTCAKYGVTPDRTAYLTAFDQGLVKYCTYEQGFELGENGRSFNQVCANDPQSGFAQGYDEGRVVYEIYAEHKRLIENYDDTLEALVEVRRRLNEDEMPPEERKRLTKKQYRLEGELDNVRIDIRAHERVNNLPRHQL